MTTTAIRTLPRFTPETLDRPRPRVRRGFRWESVVLFTVFTVAYLTVAGLLIHSGVVFADATSRVANGYFVLYSRYPRLPDLGFVWNPLPSLVLLPLLPLKSVFPALVTQGLAGAIQSALCMAGTVATVASCLRKMGVRTGPRLVLAALFGLEPMIALYGGSGQSEPMLLLFLSLAVSALLSWTQLRKPGSLVAAGVALGSAYLARYEAIAPAVAAVVLVAVISWFSVRGSVKDRLRVVINDGLLVGGPALFAVVLWAASARILVGEWFPTFSSDYGNTAQVANATEFIERSTGTGFGSTLEYLGKQTFMLAPVCVLLLVLALVGAVRRRNLAVLVAPFIFGSVMVFAAAALLADSSFGWLRFQISIIPFTVLLAGSIVATGPRTAQDGRPSRLRQWSAPAVVALAVAAAFPTQWIALTDPGLNIAREEAPALSAALHPGQNQTNDDLLFPFQNDEEISSYIDQLHLAPGTVLTDSAFAFPVLLDSTDPHAYVINSDLDFGAALADPKAHHIEYLLVRAGAQSDELQKRFPNLYASGAGVGTLVREWQSPVSQWRLFRFS